MKHIFHLSLLLVMTSLLLVNCKKEISDSDISHLQSPFESETKYRDDVPEVHDYYIDGVVATQTSYQNKLAETGVYEHIILEPTSSEMSYSHYAFSDKTSYTNWGDSLGFKISQAIYVAERLAFVADSAGFNQIDTASLDTIPEWYDIFKEDLIHNYLDDIDTPDFICYAVYFWQGYSATNIPAHTKFGGNVVSDARILFNNNKLSSWKPDVMTCFSDYKYAHLNAWDRWHYKKPIPNNNAPFPTTITIAGDVFMPFLNFYGAWDNKISSYTSWETVKP
jgi:hypothetical protein